MPNRFMPLALVLLFAGCTSGEASSPPPSVAPPAVTATATATVATAAPKPTLQPIGTVTISADGCELERSGVLHEGWVSLNVVNDSDTLAAADLFRIDSGGTFEDLARDTEEKHQKALLGEESGDHPSYLQRINTGWTVEAGEQVTITGSASPGTAAIVCLRRYEETGTINPLDTAGPIEILPLP